MENANKAVEDAVEYIKKVIKDNPQLLDFYPNLNNEMRLIGFNRAKLMKVIHQTSHLRILLDLTSAPLRKICINKGEALAVYIGKSSFAIGYELRPGIDDPAYTREQWDNTRVVEVHNIHKNMFLCFSGCIHDERAFLTEALSINKEHNNKHGRNMSIEMMANNLRTFCIQHCRSDPRCEMVIAGFDDKNAPQAYRIDPVGYMQLRTNYVTIGPRKSYLHHTCSKFFRRTMAQDQIIQSLSKSLIFTLAVPGFRLHFRGFVYLVTPEKTTGTRLIGQED